MSGDLERFDASIRGRIAYEHLHRYIMARHYVADKKVLDLACGEGYGSFLLADHAKQITGLDISADALKRAKKRFINEKNAAILDYKVGDCRLLPFENKSFEVVVAFEMIEHVEEQEQVLSEIRRVLRPDGLLIISTPNRDIYNRFKSPNLFHVREMDLEEFQRLLGAEFSEIDFVGQRMALVSSMAPVQADENLAGGASLRSYYASYDTKGNIAQAGDKPIQFEEPEYFVAFCSDEKIAHPVEVFSIYASPDDDLWNQHEQVLNWASGLHDEDEVLRRDMADLRIKAGDSIACHEMDLKVISRTISRLSASGREVEAKLSAITDGMLDLVSDSAALRAERAALIIEKSQFEQAAEREQFRSRVAAEDARDARHAFDQASLRLISMEEQLLERSAKAHSAEQQIAQLELAVKTLEQKSQEVASVRSTVSRFKRQIEEALDQERIRGEIEMADMLVRQSLPSRPGERFLNLRKPLVHHRRALAKSGLIDRGWIERTWPDGEGKDFSVDRYIADPALFARDPHPLFSAEYYFASDPALRGSGINPLFHYFMKGWREGRSPHPDFHNNWYLARNADVLSARLNPLVHYVTKGAWEDRDVSPFFDQRYYLARHLDVARSGIAPLVHYAAFGKKERRPISQKSDEWLAEGYNPKLPAQLVRLLGEALNTAPAPGVPTSFGQGTQSLLSQSDIGYQLPATLSELIRSGYGADYLPFYNYLFSVIDEYKDNQGAFANSDIYKMLVARAKQASGDKQDAQSGRELTASIIIPVYNNVLDTLICLVSVLELNHEHSFEIIVADDFSTDSTGWVVEEIGGVVRHIKTPSNSGFLLNCNGAADAAEGEFYILLNNDTVVFPGWLDELIKTCRADETIGLAGSKLLNWDGTLQEAGGIIWRDGSAWNFGRNQKSQLPEYNYLKDVDYCSAASIAVPASIWKELGGFDPIYVPAYCEDSDLAFRVRAAGYRTVYVPHSQIVHHEGRSHGRDVGSGIKAYQLRNQETLVKRWRSALDTHFENATHVAVARDRSAGKPHILIVDHYVPQWDRDAGSRTTYHYIRAFVKQGFQVSFWPDNLNYDPEYILPLQAMGVEVLYGSEYINRFASWLSEDDRKIDYILLNRPHISVHYLHAAKAHGAKVLYYGHDLHYLRLTAQLELGEFSGNESDIDAVKSQELELCRAVDIFLYPSQYEIDVINAEIGEDGRGFPIPMNIFEPSDITEFELDAFTARDRNHIMFVGGFGHTPNIDGILWFAKEVWPRVLAWNPNAKLHVAGSSPPSQVKILQSDSIRILGRISDEELDLLYRTCRVAIAPLRFGSGVKGKVIEALTKAVPIVTTSVGVQGIPQPQDMLWVADTAEEFAEALKKVENDEFDIAKKVRRGLQFIRARYSFDAAGEQIARFIPEMQRGAHSDRL